MRTVVVVQFRETKTKTKENMGHRVEEKKRVCSGFTKLPLI